MKKMFFGLLLLLAAGALLRAYVVSQHEIERLRANQSALGEQIAHYQTSLGDSAASCRVLRLRCREYEELRAQDAAEIRQLGIRLRRTEALARTSLSTTVESSAPLRDTLRLYDTLRLFRWQDPWVEVAGEIDGDTVRCRVVSVDTLVQVVHRVPRRFWFIRWGTKAIRQEIVSKNPHTRVVYAEYVALEN